MWSVARVVAAPPERLWALLIDLDAWPRWGPTVTGAELTDVTSLGLGAHGRVRTLAGVTLPFEVTAYDEGRSWAWRVAGVPATTHEVEPHPDGCRVRFGVPTWAPGYLVVCTLALRRLEDLAVSR